MDIQRAERLKKLPPYLFADLRRKMADARQRGVDVLRVDIGDPDLPTPAPVVAELQRAVDDADDPDRHRYGCDRPLAELPEAFRAFYRRRFGVELAGEQLVCTMGSKDAIAKLPLALLNPGDVGIAPVPGYPTYNIGHVFAGAVTYRVPLRRENGFLLDFDEIPPDVRREAKMLWLNYPNNPTTAVAPLEFFERAVAFGRENDILICHDAAYTENAYDHYEAPSILQVPGAAEAAVEFFSLSKAFCMTGWRVGALAGNADVVAALGAVKDNTDNGTLRGVQRAATVALNRAEELIGPINAVYQRRRDLVCDALADAGWPVEKPLATIYVWAHVPAPYAGDSGAFAADLLERTGVMVTPGRGYGPAGEGFYRIALTYPDDVLAQALDRIVELAK